MKNLFSIILKNLLLLLLVLGSYNVVFSQEEVKEEEATEEKTKDLRPVRNTFEAIVLIDNNTVDVPIKGTFEWDIWHRFGTVENGADDLFGFYAPSNLKLSFSYVPVNRLMLGFGLTKTPFTWDLTAKYALLRQARSGGSPISITLFTCMGIDSRNASNFLSKTDRYSYFHQFMVGRKFNDKLSLQVAASFSHLNIVPLFKDENKITQKEYEHDNLGVSFIGKYKVGEWINVIVNYDLNLTEHKTIDPKPNIGFGLELTSSAHQFQVFASNYYGIIPERKMFNRNDPGEGQFLIGFNMTRIWNF